MYREMKHFLPEEILVYLRKSRSDDPNMSVEEVLMTHEKILRDWIEKNLDAPIPEENWYREIVSGETIAGRPEVQKVLKRMESPKIKAILTVEVQRLSRGDLEDCGRLMKLLRYTNTNVITPYKVYDLEDEYDRDGFERELKRGNEYLEYFKKIQKRGIQQSVAEGNFIGAIAPYGYNKIKITVGKKKCPTLEINEDEAVVVRMIFDWYANDDMSIGAICRKLNEMGIKSKLNSRWTKASIQYLLNNEHYIGKIRFYYRTNSYAVVDQEIEKMRLYNEEYALYDGKHEAIIDIDLWEKAQKKRNLNPRVPNRSPLQNPFASLMYCKCGSAMSFKTNSRDKRFLCESQTRCHNSSVSYDEFVSAVIEKLKEEIENFTILKDSKSENLAQKHEEQISLLKRKIAEIENKEISLWEKYTEDSMPKTIFENLKNKFAEEKKLLETALDKACAEMPSLIDYEEKIIRLHDAIETLSDDSIPALAKNKLLRSIIKRMEYSREQSFRLSKEEAKERGVTTANGWYAPDFELDITLLI